MADIFSKAKRSEVMSKVTAKDTRPEVKIRKHLFSKGFRYRKNDKRFPGKPDIVLPKYKTVIFVHGCFWHHHTCRAARLPKTNNEFWKDKMQTNVKRDKENQSDLKKLGWKVIVVWQCQIKNRELFEKTMKRVIKKIVG